jgi:UDP-glucuronate 4-epimerase
MKILVTGAAGFIGAHTVLSLLKRGHEVIGIDNVNDYYAVRLKYDRLYMTGIGKAGIEYGSFAQSELYDGYRFMKLDLTDIDGLTTIFNTEHFDAVINLAGQAGVRYSIENPFAYAQSNLLGFLNILECCRHNPVKHLVYASSSSVYGMNEKVPYSEDDKTDSPVSLYAATKKSNELMAHAYSKLYKIPTTGLRFFTVYGPWGRPDMAPHLFLKAIINDKPINVFNHGHMKRDFTYIDDIVAGVVSATENAATGDVPFRIYNIGNSSPVDLMDFISVIEKVSGHKAHMNMLEMQPGDVVMTYADTTKLERDFGYKPSTSIEDGIKKFYDWYIDYHRDGHVD